MKMKMKMKNSIITTILVKKVLPPTLLFFAVGAAPFPPSWELTLSSGLFGGGVAFIFSSTYFYSRHMKRKSRRQKKINSQA